MKPNCRLNCPLFFDTQGHCCPTEADRCFYEEANAPVPVVYDARHAIVERVATWTLIAGVLGAAALVLLLIGLKPAQAQETQPDYMKAAAVLMTAYRNCGPVMDRAEVYDYVVRASQQYGVTEDRALVILQVMITGLEARLTRPADMLAFCRNAYKITGEPT
ncbi:MAG: hypothetical protein ACOVN5_06960 [Aquidulcibacter sp.]